MAHWPSCCPSRSTRPRAGPLTGDAADADLVGSLLGGLITLIGTPPNLLISNVRQDFTGQPFTMFDFAPVGLGVALAGIAYLTVAWRLIPADRRGAPSANRFRVEDYITEARIPANSAVIDKSIRELEAMGEDDITVIALIRGSDRRLAPAGWTRLREGDVLGAGSRFRRAQARR